MNAVNKTHAQSESKLEVSFTLAISGGTPTITNVFPACAAGDVEMTTDGGAGLTVVTIKNFKGPRGIYNIQLTPKVTSMMSAVVSDSYSGENLVFTVSTENDASTASDNVPVFVKAEAY
jgi:hypothetical protein